MSDAGLCCGLFNAVLVCSFVIIMDVSCAGNARGVDCGVLTSCVDWAMYVSLYLSLSLSFSLSLSLSLRFSFSRSSVHCFSRCLFLSLFRRREELLVMTEQKHLHMQDKQVNRRICICIYMYVMYTYIYT